MATSNSWNNQIAAANSAITLNSGTNTVGIGTDATNNTINVGTGAGVKGVTLGSLNTTSATTIDTGTGTLNLGTGATDHTTILGSATGVSATTIQAGTGALNIGANAVARATTLGNTTGASSLALKSGAGNIALNSGLTVDSVGRNYNSVQPAFLAFKSATTFNVSGTGTAVTIVADNEIYDIGGNYNAGTGVFIAPITGIYFFMVKPYFTGCTIASESGCTATTTAQAYTNASQRPAQARDFMVISSFFGKMTAGDTAIFTAYTFGEAANTDDLLGSTPANQGTMLAGYFFG